jgi:hypothetical protein
MTYNAISIDSVLDYIKPFIFILIERHYSTISTGHTSNAFVLLWSGIEVLCNICVPFLDMPLDSLLTRDLQPVGADSPYVTRYDCLLSLNKMDDVWFTSVSATIYRYSLSEFQLRDLRFQFLSGRARSFDKTRSIRTMRATSY